MTNELDPLIGQWYARLDKGMRFYVTAIDEGTDSVEVQHFDSDIEEFTLEEWRELEIELCAEPENWAGALDIAERDDLGTAITDTRAEDWADPQREFRPAGQEKLTSEP